jgi:hypothetical protein
LKARRTKHFAHNGKVKSVRHYADNDTRIAALDMTFRLKGTYAPLKTQNESRAVDVIVVDIPRPIHTRMMMTRRSCRLRPIINDYANKTSRRLPYNCLR